MKLPVIKSGETLLVGPIQITVKPILNSNGVYSILSFNPGKNNDGTKNIPFIIQGFNFAIYQEDITYETTSLMPNNSMIQHELVIKNVCVLYMTESCKEIICRYKSLNIDRELMIIATKRDDTIIVRDDAGDYYECKNDIWVRYFS